MKTKKQSKTQLLNRGPKRQYQNLISFTPVEFDHIHRR